MELAAIVTALQFIALGPTPRMGKEKTVKEVKPEAIRREVIIIRQVLKEVAVLTIKERIAIAREITSRTCKAVERKQRQITILVWQRRKKQWKIL